MNMSGTKWDIWKKQTVIFIACVASVFMGYRLLVHSNPKMACIGKDRRAL